MVKKKGLIILMVLIFILLFNDFVLTAHEESLVQSLSLLKCIQLALKDHPQIKLALNELKEAELDLEKLKMEDPRNVASNEMINKKNEIEKARKALYEIGMRLILEIETKYYQVLKNIQTVEYQRRALEWAEKQLQIVKVKYESGLVPEKDLLFAEENLKRVKQELSYACFNLTTARMELNLAMGWELDRFFELDVQQFSYKPIEVDLEESIQYALENAESIKEAHEALKQAREILELKKKMLNSTIEIIRAEHDLEKAQIQLDQVKKELVIRVRNAYLNLISSNDRVINARLAYEHAKKELEVLKVKYEAGMIPLREVIIGYNDLKDAERIWIEAIYDYNMSKALFNQIIGKKYSLCQEIINKGVSQNEK
ncbi:hypothetical protein BBF96_09255 [Anoxybacter fermentans]|uniref:TolC family protein n=1 Tax=Anoxybacter fermentans TaxID=1323375 RepID=A0A3S9SZ84_9FIRM|nr:TolC family protein [Anoxybacter fermentans]AZR73558.1 hypothetical protein BBF96_09255 [Anoxybacter fermentans]